jgi:predicted RNA-binding Zn-ribbon protein involved in translation (DUF1610 family)|nr:MAG TPA: Transcription factor S-II (TFIIS) [Bacteriophage sp.]DAX07438.1 MAG TPA: Transcription factor S-II (TFIIS) [Bacteriophage sp.]DAX09836.1 MAG TPA: Transcription factor S-II (TFIIS) [Bacteriophage sp.]
MNYEEAKKYIYNEIKLGNSNCTEILVDIAGELDQDGIEFIQKLTNSSYEDVIKIWYELKKDYGSKKTNPFFPDLTPQQIAQANAQAQELLNKPKCPTCGSTNIKKIGGVERGASIWAFGIFSKKINKTFKCGNCGYTW